MTATTENPMERGAARYHYQHSTQRQPIIEPADIRAGYPNEPAVALYLRGRSHFWIHTTPYYAQVPWPQILIAAMERWAKASQRYPQRRLPVPELDRADPDTQTPWLTHRNLDPTGRLLQRYQAARCALGQG